MRAAHHLASVLGLFWSMNRGMLATGAVLSLTTALAGIALLGLSGWFITATAIAGTTLATALAFDVFMPSAGIRLLALGRTASRYGERLTTHDAALRVLAALRERLFRGWALPGAARSLVARPSRLLFRLTLDIDALDSLYLRVIVPVFAAMGSTIAIAVALAFLDPLLGLAIGLLMLGAGLGAPVVAARRAQPQARRRAHALEIMRARTIDLVRGQADLAMANRLAAQARAISEAEARLSQADRALNRIETDVSLTLGIAGSFLLAGTLLAVAVLVERGAIGAPAAALAILLVFACLEPFAALRRGAVEFGRTLLAARRIGPRLAAEAGPEPERSSASDPDVVLDGIAVAYAGAQSPALAGCSLTVNPGERLALVGESGAGKSTLLSVIAGEIEPTHGRIAARQATLMTQRSELFRDTLRGNLELARPGASDMQLTEALAAAGLKDFVNGLDAMLGEGGAGLSAGQARRLALARLFLHDSPVWLLDEPTEGLDTQTARDVMARIGQRSQDRTVLIATHIRREAALADRLIVLARGRIVADLRRGKSDFQAILDGLRPG